MSHHTQKVSLHPQYEPQATVKDHLIEAHAAAALCNKTRSHRHDNDRALINTQFLRSHF